MAEYTFTTTAGQTVARELLLAYLNTGTSTAPVWSVIGKRVEDSSEEYDWNTESKKDILGDTYGTMKKPVITQSFEPCELDSGDTAQQKIWKMAVVDQDAMALAAQDMLIAHGHDSSSMLSPSPASTKVSSSMLITTFVYLASAGVVVYPAALRPI